MTMDHPHPRALCHWPKCGKVAQYRAPTLPGCQFCIDHATRAEQQQKPDTRVLKSLSELGRFHHNKSLCR